jgi:hypothetical protein
MELHQVLTNCEKETPGEDTRFHRSHSSCEASKFW